MARSRLAVLLLAPLVVLPAACGGGDDTGGLPTVSESAPTSSSTTPATPSTTPSPTAVPTQTVTKYRDLTLDLRRPAKVDAKAEPGVRLFLQLHEAFATMAAGGSAPADLATTAAPSVIQTLNGMLAPQQQAKERGGGTLVVRVVKAQAGTKIAVVDGCFDQRKVVTIKSNGSRYVDSTIKELPTMLARATVTGTGGAWKVTDYTLKGGSC